MASIADKIKHNSIHRVNLYKEGLFWVAYEQSAYYIWQLKGYKPSKKRYKNIDKEVVQLGFPKIGSLLKNEDIEVVTQQDTFISFNTKSTIEPAAFKIWKNTINSRLAVLKPMHIDNNIQQEIIKSICFFDCINKTPVEALFFINDLKKRILHGNI